jgi:hypothetical protein
MLVYLRVLNVSPRFTIATIGASFAGDAVRCDRLDDSDLSFPAAPTGLAFTTSGPAEDVAEDTAYWFRTALRSFDDPAAFSRSRSVFDWWTDPWPRWVTRTATTVAFLLGLVPIALTRYITRNFRPWVLPGSCGWMHPCSSSAGPSSSSGRG